MSTNKTSNFGLNQWEPGDQVRREEFNADNQKIDTALGGMLKMASGSYVGAGTFGSSAPNSLTFPFQPSLVVIQGEGGLAVIAARADNCRIYFGSYFAQWKLSWTGNSLSWHASSANFADGSIFGLSGSCQMNKAGTLYFYVAVGTVSK